MLPVWPHSTASIPLFHNIQVPTGKHTHQIALDRVRTINTVSIGDRNCNKITLLQKRGLCSRCRTVQTFLLIVSFCFVFHLYSWIVDLFQEAIFWLLLFRFVLFSIFIAELWICSRKPFSDSEISWSGKKGRTKINIYPCGVHFVTHLGNHKIYYFLGLSPVSPTRAEMAHHTPCKYFTRLPLKFPLWLN